MRSDLRTICALLKNLRDVQHAPVEGSFLNEFTQALEDIEVAADDLNRAVDSQAPSSAVSAHSIAA